MLQLLLVRLRLDSWICQRRSQFGRRVPIVCCTLERVRGRVCHRCQHGGCEVTYPGCTGQDLEHDPSTRSTKPCEYPFECEVGEVAYVYLYTSNFVNKHCDQRWRLGVGQEDEFNFGGVYGEMCLEEDVCYAIVTGDSLTGTEWTEGLFAVNTAFEEIVYKNGHKRATRGLFSSASTTIAETSPTRTTSADATTLKRTTTTPLPGSTTEAACTTTCATGCLRCCLCWTED